MWLKKVKKRSITFKKALNGAKRSSFPQKSFQRSVEKRMKNKNEVIGGPKRSAQQSPSIFKSTQKDAN